jgi:hypothetical protein
VSGCHYTMVIIQNGTRLNTTGWSKNAIFGDRSVILVPFKNLSGRSEQ